MSDDEMEGALMRRMIYLLCSMDLQYTKDHVLGTSQITDSSTVMRTIRKRMWTSRISTITPKVPLLTPTSRLRVMRWQSLGKHTCLLMCSGYFRTS